MKYFVNLILILLMITSCGASAKQENNITKHTVKKGETVYSIAKLYKTTPFTIYEDNPDAKLGIKEKDVLFIKTKNNHKNDTVFFHLVKEKETIYSITKKYAISQEELLALNPELVNGLRVYEKIKVKKVIEKDTPKISSIPKDSTYVIQKGDTKYSVTKKFEITTEELEQINPEIVNNFREGMIILIPKKKTELIIENQKSNYITDTIKPQETLYNLEKKYNISQEKLIALNPALANGLNEGMVIKIPLENEKITKTELQLKKNFTTKNITLLLPFNVAKIDTNYEGNSSVALKKDRILNVALDFYAGALMALDSLNKIGYKINLKVVDCEASKNENGLQKILSGLDFSKTDAIIGPFTVSGAEQTAHFVKNKNIPVVSPLISTVQNPSENLYYAMPTELMLMQKLYNYFEKMNGNVVAIVSTKKQSTKEKIQKNFSQTKFVALTEKGYLNSKNIENQLVIGKKNYVILETENKGFAMTAISSLNQLKAKYDIQLVVLELYDTLDFNEISIKSLTNLQLLFPSVRKENETGYYESFAKKYKDKNNVKPNKFATRGFDIMLDTALRLYQPEGFHQSTELYKSEHLQSKFDYLTNKETNQNTAVFLFYYSDDLTIKSIE